METLKDKKIELLEKKDELLCELITVMADTLTKLKDKKYSEIIGIDKVSEHIAAKIEAVKSELSALDVEEKEVTDKDIEKWAKARPGNLGNVIMDMAVTSGFIEGAKAMRDGKIK